MNLKDAVISLELKFSSNNKIDVERAVILREEWDAISGVLLNALNATAQPPIEKKWAVFCQFCGVSPKQEHRSYCKYLRKDNACI